MIPPSGMVIAAITVMLWIMWSDTLRARRPTPFLYVIRILLYLTVSGVMIVNMVRYPLLFAGTTRAMTIVGVLIGLGGATYFALRLTKRV